MNDRKKQRKDKTALSKTKNTFQRAMPMPRSAGKSFQYNSGSSSFWLECKGSTGSNVSELYWTQMGKYQVK